MEAPSTNAAPVTGSSTESSLMLPERVQKRGFSWLPKAFADGDVAITKSTRRCSERLTVESQVRKRESCELAEERIGSKKTERPGIALSWIRIELSRLKSYDGGL